MDETDGWEAVPVWCALGLSAANQKHEVSVDRRQLKTARMENTIESERWTSLCSPGWTCDRIKDGVMWHK